MPELHINKLRRGHGEDAFKVVETDPLPRWDKDAKLTVAGTRQTRVEGEEKVTGRARYAYDMRLPGQLYACILRSPHPHARVVKVDTSRAAALTGVRAVVSATDAPKIQWFEESTLFDPRVRYVGDEVAAVAADSEEIAEDALRLIEVEYEPLPFVVDLVAAQKPDAPQLHDDKPGNLPSEPKKYSRGDVEAGLREASVVVDEVYTTQVVLHNCFEPHGCTVSWEGDQLTLWDSTQSVFDVRALVAERLELAEHHVRVVKQHMGGGFGSKQVAWKHTVIAALLSKGSGRPVQLMLDRHAENLSSGNRNATRQHLRIGATADGTLTAIDLQAEQQAGAYMVGGEGSDTSGIFQTLYRCENVHTEQRAVYTNTGPAVAFRAPGHVEGAFALESAMDELARRLKIDPVELRRKNYTELHQPRDVPYTSPDSLRACYDACTEEFGWSSYQKPTADGQKRRGIGFAAHDWGGSGYPPGYAWVKLNTDGSVDVVTGTQDIGSGTRTGLAMVAAEELGMPLESIALHLGDTANGPYAPVSSGSATQATIGPAIRAAAADAKKQLLDAAATFLEVAADKLSIRDGRIWVEGEPNSPVSVANVTNRITPHMIQGHGARGPNPEDKAIRTFGAQCVEVEVDTATGEVTVLRVVASHDCGRVINPTMVDSQIIGAVTQGLGYALIEERIVDYRYGVVLNANLEEYKIPTVADIPEIIHAMVDLPDPEANPTGAKGIGEPPLIPTAPAIANAVYDATGIRVHSLPISRREMLRLLGEQAQAQAQPASGQEATA